MPMYYVYGNKIIVIVLIVIVKNNHSMNSVVPQQVVHDPDRRHRWRLFNFMPQIDVSTVWEARLYFALLLINRQREYAPSME